MQGRNYWAFSNLTIRDQAWYGIYISAGGYVASDDTEANFDANRVNRVVLVTDGDFNVGTTSLEELIRLFIIDLQ